MIPTVLSMKPNGIFANFSIAIEEAKILESFLC
jgi:hypothetical protein